MDVFGPVWSLSTTACVPVFSNMFYKVASNGMELLGIVFRVLNTRSLAPVVVEVIKK